MKIPDGVIIMEPISAGDAGGYLRASAIFPAAPTTAIPRSKRSTTVMTRFSPGLNWCELSTGRFPVTRTGTTCTAIEIG